MKGHNHLVLMSHTILKSMLGNHIFENFKDVELFRRHFWSYWSFDCSSNIDWYFLHGSSRKALMPWDMVSARMFLVPLTKRIWLFLSASDNPDVWFHMMHICLMLTGTPQVRVCGLWICGKFALSTNVKNSDPLHKLPRAPVRMCCTRLLLGTVF